MVQVLQHVPLGEKAEGTSFVWPEDENASRGDLKAIYKEVTEKADPGSSQLSTVGG